MVSQHHPQHIAIIMDGNGRWAEKRHKPRVMGHYQGAQAVRRVVELALEAHIRVLTLFAFSRENWRRPTEEVQALLSLFSQQLHANQDELHSNGVRVNVVGATDELTHSLQSDIRHIESVTENNDALHLNIALNYSGRWDIVQAARAMATEVDTGLMLPGDVDECSLAKHLCFGADCEPDLLIRTSGEMRISNFLLWQLAYTELHFTDTLWPDFAKRDFDQAIEAFNQRERRFGSLQARACQQQV